MADDEYFSSRGGLKLKGVADSGLKKKKKKKKRDIEKEMELKVRRDVECREADNEVQPVTQRYTQAEARFMERQRKMEAERILKKASQTHKEKVETFNRHLDSLTEHFDIPKVSWTK